MYQGTRPIWVGWCSFLPLSMFVLSTFMWGSEDLLAVNAKAVPSEVPGKGWLQSHLLLPCCFLQNLSGQMLGCCP